LPLGCVWGLVFGVWDFKPFEPFEPTKHFKQSSLSSISLQPHPSPKGRGEQKALSNFSAKTP